MENYSLSNGFLLKGRYIINRVIGQGGFGITYEAHDNTLDAKVCVKELYISGSSVRTGNMSVLSQGLNELAFDDFKKRFNDEAVQIAKFNHKNIVKVSDVFEHNNTVYMIMEYLEGQTLKAYIEDNGPLSTLDASLFMKQIFDAVEKVHSLGFLHRDIKPDNIIITPDNRAVLIDFGSARAYSEDKTINQTAIVSPGYAPMEQYNPSAKKGAYTDIYALGATFYFMLTGKKPLTATERNGNNLQMPHQLNPNVSTQISSAIMLAMSMEPKDRFQSIEDFRAAVNGTITMPKPPIIIEEDDDKKPKPKMPLKAILIGASVLGALLVGVIFLFFLVYSLMGSSDAAQKISLFPVSNGEKWQFIDREGKIVINPQFNAAAYFNEKFSVVIQEKVSKEDTLTEFECKFVKADGTDLNGVGYKAVTNFRENLAWVVKKNEVPKLIDSKGKEIFTFNKASRVYNFSEGLAAFTVLNDSSQLMFGFVDKKGVEKIKPQFYSADQFSQGLSVVKNKEKKCGYIDKNGKIVINFQFEEAGNFKNGYAIVKDSKDKFGTIDKEGKYVINPQFESMFSDGKNFIIVSNSKIGWCDNKGKIIINPQFEDVLLFSGNNLAPVKQDKKWGFIDKEGKFAINPQFEEVTGFNHGLAFAKSDSKWGIIDEKGKYVVNPQFDEINNFQYLNSSKVHSLFDAFSNIKPYSYVESDYFDVDMLVNAINFESPEGSITNKTTFDNLKSSYSLDLKNATYQTIYAKSLSNFARTELAFNGNPYNQRLVQKEVRRYNGWYYYTDYDYDYVTDYRGYSTPNYYYYTLSLNGSAYGKATQLFEAFKKKLSQKYSLKQDLQNGSIYAGSNFEIELRQSNNNQVVIFLTPNARERK
jgi:serine/threonine protein kinase